MAKNTKIKKWTIPLLIGAFFLVLLFNTYFNYTSDLAINEEGQSLTDKFYLAGPDPYYNARLVETTVETGHYLYMGGIHGGDDPLLNYPVGQSGGRPPLFNMMTVGVGSLLSPLVGETDALGYAMQFLPAIYGALLVFPVYLMGSKLFNRKAGILAAFTVALIPIHLSSGHGSAYSLYDHDSFVLLLTATTIMFLVMSLMEKNAKRSMVFAFMSGIGIAGMSMTWVSAQYIYALIAVYGIAQMVMDIVTSRIEPSVPRTLLIALFSGYLIAFPMYWVKYGFSLTVPLIISLAVAVFSAIYMWLGKHKLPWVISIPSIFGVGAAGLGFLYIIRNTTNSLLKPFTAISNVIFGSGIYGNKVSLTIAEASTFDFSRTVMSFGPVLYWLGWIGFVFSIYLYYKDKSRKDYFLLAVWFLMEIWLVHTAGRFLNDLVPLMAVFGGWVLWFVIDKLDFRSVIKTIKGVGGGWYGFKKGIKAGHVIGAAFVVFLVIMPNGWLAFDAALPSTMKSDFNTDKLGAFGLGLHTEEYWTDAFSWLKQQNDGINDTEKSAFISWWDYGFYCVAMAKNPTVADNFQDGIEPAANFQTAQSENEAVAVWIIRLAEGDMANNDGKVSDNVKEVFENYLGNESQDLIKILEDPKGHENSSYGEIIGVEYGGENYPVGEKNAMYHDATAILVTLGDEKITWLYHDMQDVTGNSIRYYGVEGYDVNIFNVFTFLADKGTFGYETSEDDYFKMWYVSESGQKYTPDEVKNMTAQERQDIGQLTPQTVRKDSFYNSMVYRTYLGSSVSKQLFENQTQYRQYLYMMMQPTLGLKHFVAEYISPMTQNKSLYFARGSLCFGCPAVVVAKYYEGARINGTLKSDGDVINGASVEVQRNVTMYDKSMGITHDYTATDGNGHFSVIVPAGNITLVVSQGAGQDRVIIKRITFNGTGDFAPISEDEAMRKPSSKWQRDIGTINIDKGSIKGTAYWDKDGNGEYNDSVDTALSNVNVAVGDKTVTTNSNGYYEIRSLVPNSYQVDAAKQGYDVTGQKQAAAKPGETTVHNISMVPSKITVSGETWYDVNGNGREDVNESIASMPIRFIVVSSYDENAKNATVSSNETGYYERDMSPATYSVEVSYAVNETTTYVYSGTLKLKIGDSAKTLDIKLSKA